MLRTAAQRANEILPALTHFFFLVCDADETLVGMHQWYKFAPQGMYFFCFIAFMIVLTLATNTSVLLYQVYTPSSVCIRAYHMFCMTL